MTMNERRLIEDYLPLDPLNAIAAKEKKHPKHPVALVHYWPARRPTSVSRAAVYAALEEERRGCFVAVTRTKRRLILSRARQYRGWTKPPSRFLEEMGCCLSGVRGRDTAGFGR